MIHSGKSENPTLEGFRGIPTVKAVTDWWLQRRKEDCEDLGKKCEGCADHGCKNCRPAPQLVN